MKTLKAAGVLVLLALALPTAALAHTGSATVSCTAAEFHFSNFLAGVNTVHYDVTVDNVAVAHGDFALDQSSGAGYLNVPLTVYGRPHGPRLRLVGPDRHRQRAHRRQRHGADDPLSSCRAWPPPRPRHPHPPPFPPAPPPPRSGTRECRPGREGVARRRGPLVSAPGRSARPRWCVSLSPDARCATSPSRSTGATPGPSPSAAVDALCRHRFPGDRHAAQVITAHVRFRNGAKARNLSARATRCAQVAVAPQFTG